MEGGDGGANAVVAMMLFPSLSLPDDDSDIDNNADAMIFIVAADFQLSMSVSDPIASLLVTSSWSSLTIRCVL